MFDFVKFEQAPSQHHSQSIGQQVVYIESPPGQKILQALGAGSEEQAQEEPWQGFDFASLSEECPGHKHEDVQEIIAAELEDGDVVELFGAV